uniref:TATA-box binding protein n=1 Tax=viral metagenome TaxID=1070528 RepID=A0A6C0LKS3_9ZZZZ
MEDIDAAWKEFMVSGNVETIDPKREIDYTNITVPKATDIYISTKTKIVYLNDTIDLYDAFWKMDVIKYDEECEGIIKKQVKIISHSNDELQEIKQKLSNYQYYTEYVITHLDHQQSDTNIYKDVRKLSIGISQKDLLSYRRKEKSAFYNCFVTIVRVFDESINKYKEVHVKVFNTGKIEIPGVQKDSLFSKVCNFIIKKINSITENKHYEIIDRKTETILINSNFHCGFCINRQELFNILRSKYNLNVSFDPCSYPGIQCKYDIEDHKISFMIFRTGSILIVGKCEDPIIHKVYNFLKDILHDEYQFIHEEYSSVVKPKEHKSKTRKVVIYVNESSSKSYPLTVS